MSFSASVSSILNTAWSGLQTGATFAYDKISIGVTWGAYTVDSAISGPVVASVGNIWATLGPVAGPAVLTAATFGTAFVGYKLWNSDRKGESVAGTIQKIAGAALLLSAAVLTTAIVGVASGTVGPAAYALGVGVAAYGFLAP